MLSALGRPGAAPASEMPTRNDTNTSWPPQPRFRAPSRAPCASCQLPGSAGLSRRAAHYAPCGAAPAGAAPRQGHRPTVRSLLAGLFSRRPGPAALRALRLASEAASSALSGGSVEIYRAVAIVSTPGSPSKKVNKQLRWASINRLCVALSYELQLTYVGCATKPSTLITRTAAASCMQNSQNGAATPAHGGCML